MQYKLPVAIDKEGDAMSDENKDVTNAKILELYLAGYSQKDIIQKFNITAKNLRTILHAEGIETHRFRALDEDVTNIIIQLITRGVRFNDVEAVCDISVHAIRDIVARKNLQRASKRARLNNVELAIPDAYVRNSDFLVRYLDGESFCSLCKALKLSNDVIVYEFLLVNEDQIKTHKEKLKEKVLADASLHFSTTAIAKKHTISMAIVREMLKKPVTQPQHPTPDKQEAEVACNTDEQGQTEETVCSNTDG